MACIIEVKEFNDNTKHHAGYQVLLNDGEVIELYIENYHQCCEDWGYLISEDDFSDFIGAEVSSVERTDKALRSSMVERWAPADGTIDYNIQDGGDLLFVNVHTNRGTLQFVAYNEHNGYYGHAAGVVSRYLTSETYI